MEHADKLIVIQANLPELPLFAESMGANPEDRETQQAYLTFLASNLYAAVRAVEEAAGFAPGMVNATVGASLLVGECISGDPNRIQRALKAMNEMGEQIRSCTAQADMDKMATHEAPEVRN